MEKKIFCFHMEKLNYFKESFIIGAMKDLIDERNKKEKMQNSILKWWNVHYMTPEELEEEQEKEQDPSVSGTKHQSGHGDSQQDGHDAQEIMDHIGQVAREQEEKKQREIEAAVMKTRDNYNPLTGAYSGSYGSGGADSEYEDQIAAILTEKDDALRDLIEHTEEGE